MENQKKYRITKHQSELAVRVVGDFSGRSFRQLGVHAFRRHGSGRGQDRLQRAISPWRSRAADRDDLMVNWMRELLYLYQGSGYLLKDFQIREVKDTIVKAEVAGEKIDPDRHEIKQEIAAMAFHKSRMEKTGNQWTAQVIFEV